MDSLLFISKLVKLDVPSASNPYQDQHCRDNLQAYLDLLFSDGFTGRVLVGEAPGYLGCAKTGIPFTSERIINEFEHPFLNKLRSNCRIFSNIAESTASMVWNSQADFQNPDLFWNIFPLHPHCPENSEANRPPNKVEIEVGCQILLELILLMKPQKIVCVGKKASDGVAGLSLDIPAYSIRHPANGGKTKFMEGLSRIPV